MTVENQTNKVTANGNDVATTFSFSPMVLPDSSSQLVVTKRDSSGVESTLSEGTSSTTYSVSVSSYPGTGSITYPASGGTPLATGESIVMKRVLTLEQQTDLENQGGYNPETQETQLDRLVMIDLQQQEELDRMFRLPLSASSSISVELPEPVASQSLLWASDGLSIVNGAVASAPVSTFMATVVDDTDAPSARTTLGLPGDTAGNAYKFVRVNSGATSMEYSSVYSNSNEDLIGPDDTDGWNIQNVSGNAGINIRSDSSGRAWLFGTGSAAIRVNGINRVLADGVGASITGRLLGDTAASAANHFVRRGDANSWDSEQTMTSGLNFGNETLDQYDEGTWTPQLEDSVGSATHAVQSGHYTRIGRLVHINARVRITAFGSMGTNQMRLSGLPFTPASVDGGFGFLVRPDDDWDINSDMNSGSWCYSNSGYAYFYHMDATNPDNLVGTTKSQINAAAAFQIDGWFHI